MINLLGNGGGIMNAENLKGMNVSLEAFII